MILVLGARGQVGSAISGLLKGKCIGWDSATADLSSPESIARALEGVSPSAIINAAAYTQVDKAETERALAMAVNATAPGILAAWCAKRGIPFVHYSTDYVFDGSGALPRDEAASPHPLNIYGESKLAGEKAVAAAGGKYLIFRTSWVYDETGQNFLNTMLRLGAEREELRVVADQHGAPTYAGHLAAATLKALEIPNFTPGIYHLCNGGETTWHGFAESIFANARQHGQSLAVKRVIPITSAEYPTPAVRPLNSRLSCLKAKELLGLAMPAWQEGLNACMEKKYGN